MEFIKMILIALAVYLGCGLLFSIAFVVKGLDKTDESAHGCSIGFRIIIIPGTMVFWPLFLKKWMNAVKRIK